MVENRWSLSKLIFAAFDKGFYPKDSFKYLISNIYTLLLENLKYLQIKRVTIEGIIFI